MTVEKLPKIAAKNPFKVKVEAGKIYSFCPCGLSKKQPFCDGSHKAVLGEDGLPLMRSIKYKADENKELYFCGCKNSKEGMFCDGTHSKL